MHVCLPACGCERVCVFVSAWECVSVGMSMSVFASVCVCECVCVCVRAWVCAPLDSFIFLDSISKRPLFEFGL